MKETVYAFIDSQNLHRGVNASGWELDYKKFANYLKTKYNVTKSYLFIGYIPANESLYKYLEDCGYILVHKPVLEFKKEDDTVQKGNVDAELVLHAMVQYKNCDKAVIVSGDGDFYCLIEHLHENKKLLRIVTPNKKYSSLIKQYSGCITPLNLVKKKLAYTKSNKK